MFKRVSEKIVDGFISDGAVTADERELYQYGVSQGFTIALNIVTILAIGLLLNTAWQTALFFIAYVPMRIFAGGYHAKTPLKCYVLSVAMIAVVSLMMKYINFTVMVCIVFLAISALVISLLSPIEDRNKPLDETEMKVYKKRTFITLLIETAIVGILIALGFVDVAICIALAFTVLGVMLIAGKVKNGLS